MYSLVFNVNVKTFFIYLIYKQLNIKSWHVPHTMRHHILKQHDSESNILELHTVNKNGSKQDASYHQSRLDNMMFVEAL